MSDNYPWFSNFLIEAAEPEEKTDAPAEEAAPVDDGTNEPVTTDEVTDENTDALGPNIESKNEPSTDEEEPTPEEDTIQDAPVEESVSADTVDVPEQDAAASDATEPQAEDAVEEQPAEDIEEDSSNDIQKEVEDLKEQLAEIKKNFDMEDEVKAIKRRLDNMVVPDETDLNDSLFQIARKDIQIIKRAIRRCYAKISSLTGNQQERIVNEVRQNPQLSYQEVSKKLSGVLGARQHDIFDFLMNTDTGIRHKRSI